MKPKVYVETTILSYLAARSSRNAVTAGRQAITQRWWETEREKYNLVVSEAVEAECERGDPELVKRRQKLLEDVSLFPVDERILEVARRLVVPGAIPPKGRPGCGAYRRSGSGRVRVSADLELPAHRECSDSAGSGKDSGESWLHTNEHLYPGRAYLTRNVGKMKCCTKFMRRAMPMQPSMVTI